MHTNLYTVTIPPMKKALAALSVVLEKAAVHAEARKTPRLDFEHALLQDRIVFDQFPLVRQVQIASDNAKNAIGRLTGKEMPVFEDTESTFAELQERLQKTIALLEEAEVSDIVGAEDVRVSLPYWGGKSLSGFEYVTEYLIPNFYFHVVTAYAIVRKNGIAVGKADYMGPLSLKD